MFIVAGLYLGNFPVQYGTNWQTSHFWSLAVEEQFYIIFPLLFAKSVNKYFLTALTLIIMLPAIVAAGRIPLDNNLLHKIVLAFTYLLGYGTTSILIGSLASILIFKGVITINFKQPYLLSIMLLIAAIALHIPGVLSWNVTIYIFPILIVTVIILNLKNAGMLSKILNTPAFSKLGMMSYSVYIWQQLFSYDRPWRHLFKGSDTFTFNFIALSIVSTLSYYLYEKRFLRLKRHLKRS